MLHFFKHGFNSKEYYFIWDIESGSLHSTDNVTFLCAKKYFSEKLTIEEESELAAIDGGIIDDINGELAELVEEGVLNAPCKTFFAGKNSHIVKSMCFNICHDCNMRCAYCFADGGAYNSARSMMSLDIGKRAVDFLIANSGSRKNLEIDFFGGEPLLNLDTVKGIVEYAKEKAEENGKVFSFTITTNCVLLDDETIEYINDVMDNVVLSIDGRKCTHDRVRHPLDKKYTYETITNNAKRLKETRKNKSYYVRGTFTSENLDFAEDILALNDMGFDQISVEPVVLDEKIKIAIKKEHLDRISEEYERFANLYLERRKGEKWFNFFHFMVDLESGPCVHKRMTGCGAGTEYLSVTPEGDIYPCHQFVGEREYLLGNVFEGILRQDIRDRMASVSIASKPKCQSCFAKYYCGGGCYANACKFGDGNLYELGCEMTKKRFELSLAVAGIEKAGQNE